MNPEMHKWKEAERWSRRNTLHLRHRFTEGSSCFILTGFRCSQSQQHCLTSLHVQTALLHLCGISFFAALDSGPRGHVLSVTSQGNGKRQGGAQTKTKANTRTWLSCAHSRMILHTCRELQSVTQRRRLFHMGA